MDRETLTKETKRLLESPSQGFAEMTKGVANSAFSGVREMKKWAKENGLQVFWLPAQKVYFIISSHAVNIQDVEFDGHIQ